MIFSLKRAEDAEQAVLLRPISKLVVLMQRYCPVLDSETPELRISAPELPRVSLVIPEAEAVKISPEFV